MRTQKHLSASLSSAGVSFKRVGLHYIAFSEPAIAKTRLVSLPTSKIAGLGISVTNFGYVSLATSRAFRGEAKFLVFRTLTQARGMSMLPLQSASSPPSADPGANSGAVEFNHSGHPAVGTLAEWRPQRSRFSYSARLQRTQAHRPALPSQ